MKKLIPIIVKYGITVAVGAVMSYIVFVNYGYTPNLPAAERYKILCDAFSIPGIMLTMIGALVFLSNEGAMDGISFLMGGLFKRLMPIGRWRDEKDETYAEHIARKRANRVTGYGFVFVVGGAYLAVAAVFMILFYQVY